MHKLANLDMEREIWKKGYLIIGVDEVGRGCLAGPVGVGAVCFDPNNITTELENLGIHDCKKVSAKTRKLLSAQMQKFILASSVTFSSVSCINSKGIVPAVQRAVRQSIATIASQLQTKVPIFLFLDAFPVKHIPHIGLKNQMAIIKGDEKSISIAAASILAKVQRDALMSELSSKFKVYNWHLNKGYGTRAHLEAIKAYGPTKEHRKLYIRNVLNS